MNPRDLYIDEWDAPSIRPTFVNGMKVEDVGDQMRDVAVHFEDADGRHYDCTVTYDGDSVAYVDGYDERGNRAAFTLDEVEAIVMIAARSR